MKLLAIFPALAFAILPIRVFAHEFWIEPEAYQVNPGNTITATFRIGENFSGTEHAYFDFRSTRLERAGPDGLETLRPRSGDLPAIVIPGAQDGLTILMHETAPGKLKYKTWEEFQKFADHKSFREIEARHAERGLPKDGFSESYTRHAKSLIGVGDAQGADAEFGMETEFVALSNPYTEEFNGEMVVQLLYLTAPRMHAQVEIFDRDPSGVVSVTMVQTDADGIVRRSVEPGHSYLFDAVVLRPAADDDTAVWETIWASLTFAVPR